TSRWITAAEPRRAGLLQTAAGIRRDVAKAVLEQPSPGRFGWQALGRRNIAPLTSSELDPSAGTWMKGTAGPGEYKRPPRRRVAARWGSRAAPPPRPEAAPSPRGSGARCSLDSLRSLLALPSRPHLAPLPRGEVGEAAPPRAG